MNLEFALFLVKYGIVTSDQFVAAVDEQIRRQPPIGSLAIRANLMTVRQVIAVLESQELQYRPFGQIAIDMGFLTVPQVERLLAVQVQSRPNIDQLLMEQGQIDAGQWGAMQRAFQIQNNRPSEKPCRAPNFARPRATPAEQPTL